MTSTGMKYNNLIAESIKYINDALSKRYEQKEAYKKIRFYIPEKAHYFNVDVIKFKDNPCIVIEHAHTEDEAMHGLFEDGDSFSILDMTNEEILKAVIAEIEEE